MELDCHTAHFGCETGLVQVHRFGIDSDYAVGAAALHLDRIETAVAGDIQHGHAAQVFGHGMGEAPPLHVGIIAQEMIGSGPHPLKLDIAEPLAQIADPAPDFVLLAHHDSPLIRRIRGPQGPISTVLIDPGTTSSRSSLSIGMPSQWVSTARIKSQWLTRTVAFPGVRVSM